MRGYDGSEPRSRRGDSRAGEYVLCVGGYPRQAMSSFEAAVARAWELSWSESGDDFSIYEVETGIHFEVPLSPPFDAAFDGGHRMR